MRAIRKVTTPVIPRWSTDLCLRWSIMNCIIKYSEMIKTKSRPPPQVIRYITRKMPAIKA